MHKNYLNFRAASIQVKIGVAMILLNTLILLGFALFQYLETSSYESERLAIFAAHVASQLSINLASPLWDIDELQVARAVEAEMQDENIQTIVVKNQKQHIFIAKTRDEAWALVDARAEVSNAKIPPTIADIILEDKPVGTVEVYITRRFLQTHLNTVITKIGIIACVCDVVLFGLLILSIRLLLIRPLASLLLSANAIAAGDFQQEMQIRQQDEIGALADAFQQMKTTITQVLQELRRLIQAVQDGKLDVRGEAEAFYGVWQALIIGMNQMLESFVIPMTQMNGALAQVAQGDLTGTLNADYQGDFRTIMQQLESMTAKLTTVVRHVKTAASDVAQRSREMSAVAGQMSEGASQQAAATEEVSASMEEMAANIRQTANNAKQTEQIARKSADDARAGRAAVTQIIDAMEVVAERISVIQEIASQTNMLSLNATIEAAKAQDYGKGFTVVASSVRDLARQSRAAAEEMRTLVHSCVILSAQAGDVLERLVPNSEHTAELVQEISGAAQEQATGVEHVNQAVQQLDLVTQHNAATAEELSSTVETLTTQAEVLQKAMAFFTVNEKLVQTPTSTEEADLLQRLQGVAKDRLLDLVKQALTHETASVSASAARSQMPLIPPHLESVQRPILNLAANNDERDEEFERY